MRLRSTLLLGAVVLAAGCAGTPWAWQGVAVGMPRATVVDRLGPPTRSVTWAGGERLQYSLQPAGQAAFMVDLDAAGNVAAARQVLVPAEFARITEGQWRRADVERELGPPARVDRVAHWPGDVLTYRWSDGSDMFFWVYLDADQVVRRTQQGMEFVNAPDRE
ncbi:MAG: hypothetical protein KIS62_14085 [Ramlibacter sp.]|nr:hypothetical protein [Ramlibacter sp.]MCW5650871.1 hypothetical protein [Ramlibacter sp.]